MSAILILGAGGHGKVVADILLCNDLPLLGFLDDDPQTWGTRRLGLSVLGGLAAVAEYAPAGVIAAIGDNAARREIVQRLGEKAAGRWVNALHPRAVVAASVKLETGIVIVAGAVVNPDTIVGQHAIISTGATVDHDVVIADYAHIAPGAHICGGVRIDQGALIGAGATVTPGCHVGAWATVGAGAVVLEDVPANVVAKGVPARW